MGTAALHSRLLGELELRLDGMALPPLESARAESLLAFLLVHRQAPQPRQRLAFELWPDSTEAQARTNLRHVLHNLRRGLPDLDRLLEVTPRTLRWRVGAIGWLDVAAFEEALSRAEGEADAGLAALRDAVDLYRGDLLEGRHDEWLQGERERLRQRFLGALERLVALLEARGEQAEAIGHAERLLAEDPLQEEAYRLLMRLHDARGDRARALRTYHACTATLERELGVAPSAPTRRLYEGLLPSAARPRRSANPDREVRSAVPHWWDAPPSGPG
jgi:DNA-binding SARP family transcriptional activator